MNSICKLLTLIVLINLSLIGTLEAQQKSVNPGINDSFNDQSAEDVSTFVERFEKEGREVYDQREQIVEYCKLRPAMAIADVGAGTGLFTRMMSPRVGKLYAVDISEPFLTHINEGCEKDGVKNVETVLCTEDSVNLPADSVDLVFICDTYHHFEFPYRTMRSIHKALRSGGEVVLVEFDRIEGESSEWILKHLRADRETFTSEIEMAGFEEVDLQDEIFKTSYMKRFKKSARQTKLGHTIDSVEQIKNSLANQTATMIDVREQSEWDSGHLSNATLIPLSKIRGIADDAEKLAELFPADQIIYCHCKAGGRTLVTAEILKKHGYDIRPLADGFDALVEKGFEKDE